VQEECGICQQNRMAAKSAGIGTSVNFEEAEREKKNRKLCLMLCAALRSHRRAI